MPAPELDDNADTEDDEAIVSSLISASFPLALAVVESSPLEQKGGNIESISYGLHKHAPGLELKARTTRAGRSELRIRAPETRNAAAPVLRTALALPPHT